MSIQHHAATILRAAAQMADYTFRRMTVKTSAGPVSIVYVYGPQGQVYQVTPGRHHYRCSCLQYTKRCAGTLTPCKHCVMVKSWEERERRAQLEQEQAEADAACRARLAARALEVERAGEKARETRAAFLAQLARDFPSD
jgi:hypothetical protein